MLKYQKIVMRAHEAFHRRLRQVEVELAEAKHSLEQLDIRYSVHERKAAMFQALEHRLPDDLLCMIVEQASK